MTMTREQEQAMHDGMQRRAEELMRLMTEAQLELSQIRSKLTGGPLFRRISRGLNTSIHHLGPHGVLEHRHFDMSESLEAWDKRCTPKSQRHMPETLIILDAAKLDAEYRRRNP